MKLYTLLVLAIGITCPLVAEPKNETTKPDYYTYQADGSVKTRCIYSQHIGKLNGRSTEVFLDMPTPTRYEFNFERVIYISKAIGR